MYTCLRAFYCTEEKEDARYLNRIVYFESLKTHEESEGGGVLILGGLWRTSNTNLEIAKCFEMSFRPLLVAFPLLGLHFDEKSSVQFCASSSSFFSSWKLLFLIGKILDTRI